MKKLDNKAKHNPIKKSLPCRVSRPFFNSNIAVLLRLSEFFISFAELNKNYFKKNQIKLSSGCVEWLQTILAFLIE